MPGHGRDGIVGYGCTTCIGNSGPLLSGIFRAVTDGGWRVCSVLSGDRNFEGLIHPEAKMSHASAPRC